MESDVPADNLAQFRARLEKHVAWLGEKGVQYAYSNPNTWNRCNRDSYLAAREELMAYAEKELCLTASEISSALELAGLDPSFLTPMYGKVYSFSGMLRDLKDQLTLPRRRHYGIAVASRVQKLRAAVAESAIPEWLLSRICHQRGLNTLFELRSAAG